MSIDEAILQLRRDPRHAALVRDAYLEEDTRACAERFLKSGEFEETLRLLGSLSRGSILARKP